MNNEQFDDLAAAFGADFEPEDNMPEGVPILSKDEIEQNMLAKIDEPEDEENDSEDLLPSTNTDPTVRIQDEHYMQNEYRMGVEMINGVAEVLRQDLNQGSRASSFEAFSSLMRERRENITALENINTKIYDRNTKNEGPEINAITGQNITNNMVFTSEDALNLILQAKNGLDPTKEI